MKAYIVSEEVLRQVLDGFFFREGTERYIEAERTLRAILANEPNAPSHWYLEDEDEYMSEELRKVHEQVNSHTFKLCKVAIPLYKKDI